MIEAKKLSKAFGEVKALDGVSFTARDGEVTGLIGPNGAGKTTALRILYSIMKPDSGTALVDGHDSVTDHVAVRSCIGVLPDSRGLYARLTGREHIRYFGRLHGLTGSYLETRIDDLIATLGMGEFADRRAKGYSKGQTLKVALARALVHEPQNLMLDEPTNGLDIHSSRAVRALIGRIRDEGRCILYCSHIMQEVSAICDQIVIVAEGRVVAHGTPTELRDTSGCKDMEDVFLYFAGPGSLPGAPVPGAGNTARAET